MSYKLLIVDDDAINLEAMRLLLQKHGFTVETALSGDAAIRKVSSAPYDFGLVILDYRMEGKDGAETAREILAINRHCYVLIHSGDESRDALQSTWDAGAVKFIEKSRGAEFFLETIKQWALEYETKLQPLLPRRSLEDQQKLITAIGMIGRSASLANIARRIQKYGEERSDLSVLVLGENGSGKEGIARAIHAFSARKSNPFVAIDAGSLPENLVESELFGHERGAFTGADQKRVGSFQFAERGTLFLDEIGNISLAVQAKLLRVLQQKTIRPVGSNKEIKVDVRIVAATNVDLKKAVREGKFREDLYYRLKGVTIAIPPLRERPEDVEPLVAHFTNLYNRNAPKPKTFLQKAVRRLERHLWPGNVRELENTVYELLTESYSDSIGAEELDDKLPKGQRELPTHNAPQLKTYVDEVTRDYVVSLLRTSRSKLEAAQRAGMAETTFRDLLRRLGLLETPLGRLGKSGDPLSPEGP